MARAAGVNVTLRGKKRPQESSFRRSRLRVVTATLMAQTFAAEDELFVIVDGSEALAAPTI